jgi:hypothetical protein
MGPKGEPDIKTNWWTDRQPQNKLNVSEYHTAPPLLSQCVSHVYTTIVRIKTIFSPETSDSLLAERRHDSRRASSSCSQSRGHKVQRHFYILVMRFLGTFALYSAHNKWLRDLV